MQYLFNYIYLSQRGKMSTLLRCLCFLLIVSLISAPFAGSIGINTTSEKITRPVVKVKVRSKKVSIGQQEDFEKLLTEGKRLYLEEMDNDGALVKFMEAEALTQTREQKAEVYFYVSLIYYAQSRDIGNEEFDRAVRRLIELDYYRELDKNICPPKYLELYGEIKNEFGVLHVQSSPQGAEVYVDNSREVFGLTPVDIGHKEGSINLRVRKGKAEKSDTLRVSAGTETSSPVYKLKRRSSLLFIVGGVALAGGLSAVLFLKKKEQVEPKGSIQVNSTPSGAEILLDDRSTGQITNSTLTDVAVGSHTVEVAREGYRNEMRNVVVEDGQTATVSVDLVKHTFTVTQPEADVIWIQGEQEEIKWDTGTESSASVTTASNLGPIAILNRGIENYQSNMSKPSRSLPVSLAGNERVKSQKSFDVDSIDFTSQSRANSLYKTRTNIIIDRLLPYSSSSLPRGSRSDPRMKRPSINSFSRSSKQDVRTSGDIHTLALTNVKIQLYKGSSLVETITESTANNGSYTWTVSTSLQGGSDYRVKVSCVDEPSVTDQSEEFMITHGYQFLTKWGSGGEADGLFSNQVWGIAISGYVYVTDSDGNRIQKFTSEGTFVGKWGSYGSGDGQFDNPRGIEADSTGNIYVADSATGNSRIQKFTSNGEFVAKWGKVGSANGEFNWPYDIAFDSSGNCYVIDLFNHRVQKFTSDGTFIRKWGFRGSGNGQFIFPAGIAVDQAGFVYVADTDNHRIQKFTLDGIFVTKWGALGTADGDFSFPKRIDIDSSGYVYVADSGNKRIQKFSSDGMFILKWGELGNGDGQFDNPTGIAVDESGNVYVCDSGNSRVQKFGSNTTQSLNKK